MKLARIINGAAEALVVTVLGMLALAMGLALVASFAVTGAGSLGIAGGVLTMIGGVILLRCQM